MPGIGKPGKRSFGKLWPILGCRATDDDDDGDAFGKSSKLAKIITLRKLALSCFELLLVEVLTFRNVSFCTSF